MKKTISILAIFVALFCTSSCKKSDETKQPKACFNFTPQDKIIAGSEVIFTNCSTDAESYEWNFGDGSELSTLKDPTHKYTKSGTFEVRLSVLNKDLDDHEFISLTVEPSIDPKDYYAEVPEWVTEYADDFSKSGTWYEGTGDNYEFKIADGFYTLINLSAESSGWDVINQSVKLPSGNYDIEVLMRNTVDNGNYGSGLLFGSQNDSANFFSFTSGYYIIGSTSELWKDWTETSIGNFQDWNLLTIRKYFDNYYFFINEVFIYSHNYKAYGDLIGFTFDKNTQVDIDLIAIYSMNFDPKKSGNIKTPISTNKHKIQCKLKAADREFSLLR